MLDLRLALPDEVQHLAVGNNPIKVRCVDPVHRPKDKNQSLAVYPDHIVCYGCPLRRGCNRGPGACGNKGFAHSRQCEQWQREALALLLGIPVEEVVEARYTNESLDAYRERAATEARRDPLPSALADAYHALLYGPRVERLDWLTARGLTYQTIDEFKLGHDGFRFVIPVYDAAGELLTLRYRRDDEYQSEQRPKYSGLPGRNGFYLYPEWKLPQHLEWLFVCEGELDAVRCWQQGWPAVSATNGARQVPKVIPALKQLLPGLTTIILATDQDEAGKEAANVAGRDAEALGLRVFRLCWDGAKDITEALQLDVGLRREPFAALRAAA